MTITCSIKTEYTVFLLFNILKLFNFYCNYAILYYLQQVITVAKSGVNCHVARHCCQFKCLDKMYQHHNHAQQL